MVLGGLVHRGFVHEGHRRVPWVGGEDGSDMQERAEWDVPQVRGRAVVAHEAVGQHREGLRYVLKKHLAASRKSDAAPPVDVIHKDEFAAVGACFFQRHELAGWWAEGLFGIKDAAGQAESHAQSDAPSECRDVEAMQ
jgi:hypothetical protein